MPDPAKDSRLRSALRSDRVLLVCGLLFACVAAWAYLLSGAGPDASGMSGMPMPADAVPWTARHAVSMLVMWTVMMAAMMLPSAAPMILFHHAVSRAQPPQSGSGAASYAFVSGYLAVWTAFGAAAVLVQFGLETATLLDPMAQTAKASLAGGILIACGLYQWTPLKQACLRRCRSPIEFIIAHWRPGSGGAFVMGMRHGIHCVGCCWMLMLLLFVGGVMNVGWIAAIAVLVLIEKVAPHGHWTSRALGGILVAWGALTLLRIT